MIRHSPLRESAGVRNVPTFTPKPYRMTPKSTKDIMREQNFINDSVRGKHMDANYRPIKIYCSATKKARAQRKPLNPEYDGSKGATTFYDRIDRLIA